MKLLIRIKKTVTNFFSTVGSFLNKVFKTKKSTTKDTVTSLNLLENQLAELLNTNNLIEKAEDITTILYDLKKTLNHHKKLKYRYSDVLEQEVTHFLNEEICYLDGFTGNAKVISFSEARIFKNANFFRYNEISPTVQVPPKSSTFDNCTYFGNQAIGQIFINNKEAFCPAVAIEFSLRSTVMRWYKECYHISKYFERISHES